MDHKINLTEFVKHPLLSASPLIYQVALVKTVYVLSEPSCFNRICSFTANLHKSLHVEGALDEVVQSITSFWDNELKDSKPAGLHWMSLVKKAYNCMSPCEDLDGYLKTMNQLCDGLALMLTSH